MEEHEEAGARDARDERLFLQVALRHILGHQAGRKYVWGLLQTFGLYDASFAPGDPHMTSHREGLRLAALQIIRDAGAYAPALCRLMREENEGDDKT